MSGYIAERAHARHEPLVVLRDEVGRRVRIACHGAALVGLEAPRAGALFDIAAGHGTLRPSGRVRDPASRSGRRLPGAPAMRATASTIAKTIHDRSRGCSTRDHAPIRARCGFRESAAARAAYGSRAHTLPRHNLLCGHGRTPAHDFLWERPWPLPGHPQEAANGPRSEERRGAGYSTTAGSFSAEAESTVNSPSRTSRV